MEDNFDLISPLTHSNLIWKDKIGVSPFNYQLTSCDNDNNHQHNYAEEIEGEDEEEWEEALKNIRLLAFFYVVVMDVAVVVPLG
jgi:hypothetical protein